MIASSSDHYTNNFCAKYSQLSSVPSSPERRFKSISPCRKLFEDVSTNQNQSSVVVSNASVMSPFHLATITSSHCNNNNHNINHNNNHNNTHNNDIQFEFVTKDVGIINSSHLVTTTSSNSNSNIEDLIFSSYQRRRNIKTVSNNNHNTLSSPFMDDLGFLYTSSNSNYESDMNKKTEESTSSSCRNNNNNNSELRDSIKSFSSVHWNRRSSSSIVPNQRRCMSVSSCVSMPLITENGSIHHLPCFDSPHDAIKRISPDTLVDLLEGKFADIFERVLIVDCRYPYEYEGGHIPTAINVNNPEVIEKLLFEEASLQIQTAIVFHCEFSSERAPRMALHVRNLDRQLNKSSYPALFYPEMYILDGGYKNYWQRHGDKCEPPKAYLPMRNPEYRDQLRHHQKIKYAFKSGCHLSQHSAIKKKLPPKSRKSQERSKSLNIANARKFFNDLIQSSETRCSGNESDQDLSFNATDDNNNNSNNNSGHLFPSFSIPTANSFSSIFASELDIPDEMDMD